MSENTQESSNESVDTSQEIEASQEESTEVEASEEVVSTEGEAEEVEASGEEASQEETDEAAKKLKAKEVKGSDGEQFKIKVDGQELELTKEEVIRYAQMGKAGQRAMQEKAEIQKRTVEFIKALQNDPESVLADEAILGSREKVIELAQKILSKQLEEEALTPEQKKLKEVESELERYRKEAKEAEENRKKQEYENEVKKYEDELQTQVQEALEAEKLPKNPAILNKMAEILLLAHDKQLKVTPRQAAKLAKEEIMNDVKGLAQILDDEQLESLFGTEVITRMRKATMKKVKPAIPSVKVDVTGKSVKDSTKKKEDKIGMRDFMKSVYFGK